MLDVRAIAATAAVHAAAWTLAPLVGAGWSPHEPGCHLCLYAQPIMVFTVPDAVTFAVDPPLHTPDPLVATSGDRMTLQDRRCAGASDQPPRLLSAPTLPAPPVNEPPAAWEACVAVGADGQVESVIPVNSARVRLSNAARGLRFDRAPARRVGPRIVRVSLRYI